MKKVENCKLISKTEIIDGIFDFVIESEDISKEAQCGQFLHINCGDSTFLRRPISICDAENGKVRFIFEVKGKGTEELAKKEVGDSSGRCSWPDSLRRSSAGSAWTAA